MKKGELFNSLAYAVFSLFLIAFFTTLISAADPSWNVTQPVYTQDGQEDQLYTYNLTANISNPDPDEVLFSFYTLGEDKAIVSDTHGTDKDVSFFDWISLNTSTGILTINSTRDNETAVYNMTIDLSIPGPTSFGTKLFIFNITTVNDAPIIHNLTNEEMNRSFQFDKFYNITDEENDFNFTLNITFLSCEVAAWSTRNCSGSYPNLTLFNESDYVFNGTAGWLNLSFTPTVNDVGNYTINFTITDSGETNEPYNASRSYEINFSVLNINQEPSFTFVCDSDQIVNATEDTEFTCYINATDADELANLTFYANETWFNFTESNTSIATISDQYNFSTQVKINATDLAVGNWTVNITINDTGTPLGINSTLLYFYIDNINDSVAIENIPNQAIYSSNNQTIYVIATDDDLLIPDESVYDESLTFTSNNSNVEILETNAIFGTNKINATIYFDGSDFTVGVHSINISVNDSNGYSIASDVFTITITDNNAPYWNSSTIQEYSLTEDTEFYLNLSNYTIDADAEDLNFSYSDPQYFDNFNLDADTGIINFTPQDIDVGVFNMTITVTDGKTPANLDFNFTVTNVPDNVTINQVTISGGDPSTVSNGGSTNISEDNATVLLVTVTDHDFNISQTPVEDLTITTNITGPNSTLFTFGDEIDTSLNTRKSFSASFTPEKADVGDYNITLNVTDAFGDSEIFEFNLTILAIDHAPNFTEGIENQVLSILAENLTMDINASDEEDGDEDSGNITYVLTNLTAGGNFLTINSTHGKINFTTSAAYAGLWEYEVTINDTTGNTATDYFNVTIYDYPTISLPLSSFNYSMVENETYQLNFTTNHTVQDELTYTLIINGVTKNTTTGNGNGTEFLWNYTPYFDEETTCLGNVNLTLNVSNTKLSNTTDWSVEINHTNFPLTFNQTIADQEGGSPVSLTLSQYFYDYDAADSCRNQSVTFNYTLVENSTSGGSITVTLTDWINTTTPLSTFTAGAVASANYSITAYERTSSDPESTILLNATSNNFSVTITPESTTETTTTTGGGGGGGGTGEKLISLKIIVPEPVSAKQKDKLIIPLTVMNDGNTILKKISLSALIAKDGLLRDDLVASFDNSFIEKLNPNQKQNVTMIVDIETTATGLFEVTINATVADPKYADWAKMYIEIDEEVSIFERIVFTEEFLIGNPVCAEYNDLINEAKLLFEEGKTQEAMLLSENALSSCKQAIAQPPSLRIYERFGDEFFTYAAIASLVAFALGFGYYYYRRIRIKRQLVYVKENFNK